MKKIFTMFVSMLVCFAIITEANAASAIKNYYAYTIRNEKINSITQKFSAAVTGENSVKKLTGTPNAYYLTYQDEHYYMKFYPANTNTDVYIVSDAEYDKNKNEMTDFFKQYGWKYAKLEDEEALREYKFDFIDYARTGNLEGLFILPDYIKPLKTGMGKLSDKISKDSKKTSAIAYSPDSEPIDLTCVNTETYQNNAAQVTVTVKEFRLKNKQNKYVHAYEYVVKNTAASPLLIDKVSSERIATMKDITSQTFVDLDRLDLADTVGSFPPVAICTCGASLAFTVANNVRLAKVAKESLRFAKSLPENYTIPANGKMRILVLKFKNDPKALDFKATRNGETFTFSY